MRGAVAIFGLLVGGCAVTPTYVYDLADATRDQDVEAAVEHASRLLRARRRPVEVRQAAAKVLGRLRPPGVYATEALGEVLLDPREPDALRAWAAWALGEQRRPASLQRLGAALRSRLAPATGQLVLEGIAKHGALFEGDADALVEVVEAMVFYAANQRAEVPAVYDVIGDRTRTVAVNVTVLARAVAAVHSAGGPSQRAAMYQAAFELLSRLEASRDEIVAGAASWSARIDAALGQARSTLAARDPETTLLVLWYLGRLASLPELAAAGGEVLAGGAAADERPSARLVATWALARMQLHHRGARELLRREVLAGEHDPLVLQLVADLSARPEDFDLAQKILGDLAAPRSGR